MGFLSLIGAEEPDPTAPSPTKRFSHGRGQRATRPVAPCVAHEFEEGNTDAYVTAVMFGDQGAVDSDDDFE